MSELLAAASLLMTVIAILYSLWHNELISGLKINPGRPADNRPSERKIRGIILTKALPLAVMAWATALVFLPDVIRLSFSTIGDWLNSENNQYRYNAVNTALCLVVIISLFLSGYATAILVGLVRLWSELRKR